MAVSKRLTVNGRRHDFDRRSGHAAALCAARQSRAQGTALRLRSGAMRLLHRACRRQGGALVRDAAVFSQRKAERVVTLEGLGSAAKPHPVQRAFIEEQAAQCGYCINGMIMESAAFLAANKKPTDAQIKEALAKNLCRCGTHARIVRAVKRAASYA